MPPPQSLLERLAEGPVVGDGAMGTYLHELGHNIRRGPEALVLDDPEAVRRVHAAYLDAGAELLETDTYAANAPALEPQGLAGRVREINAAAVRLALEAAGRHAWVAGAIGPVPLAPHDEGWNEARVRSAYREQAQALCEAGVHALLLETFDDLHHLLLALAEARAAARDGTAILAQMVFADGRAACGVPAADVARSLIEAGANVVGANCGRGVQSVGQALDGLLAGSSGRAFVSVYPNAGYPERIGGRTVYLSTPAYLAAHAADWARRGVRLIGGCCGTTPESVRAIRQALAALRRVPAVSVGAPLPAAGRAVRIAAAANAAVPPSPGRFLGGLHGRLPAIAEIDPPPHLDWQPVLAGARSLLEAGCQAISLAENPLASIRMDNLFVGAAIRRETGGQVVCHVTCRDRNTLGLQSALLGAHAAGIEAVLAVTGDPTPRGGPSRSVSVYEITSLGLVRLLAGLNRGRNAAGRDLRGATAFSIGVAFNAGAADLDAEAARLRRKAAEGAAFAMTQPVFTADRGRAVLDSTRPSGLRVFLGFLPPVTLRLALYLHNEVPGIRLPEELLARLASFADEADQQRAALEHTAGLLDALAGEMDGVYLMAPGGRWKCLLPLLERVRALRGAG